MVVSVVIGRVAEVRFIVEKNPPARIYRSWRCCFQKCRSYAAQFIGRELREFIQIHPDQKCVRLPVHQLEGFLNPGVVPRSQLIDNPKCTLVSDLGRARKFSYSFQRPVLPGCVVSVVCRASFRGREICRAEFMVLSGFASYGQNPSNRIKFCYLRVTRIEGFRPKGWIMGSPGTGKHGDDEQTC